MMKILIAYDGSASADKGIDDLRRPAYRVKWKRWLSRSRKCGSLRRRMTKVLRIPFRRGAVAARAWTPGSEVRVVVAEDVLIANSVYAWVPPVNEFVDEN